MILNEVFINIQLIFEIKNKYSKIKIIIDIMTAALTIFNSCIKI